MRAFGERGAVSNTLNWSLFRWNRQLEKISNFSVSQFNELDVGPIDWYKTILSWIVFTRFIIDRFLLLAHLANIYTVLTRRRQNLLILWMVLSFLKDIIVEIIVIVITFLLWRKEDISVSLLVEFTIEKILCLVISIGKWCTTFKWYMQLRRIEKIRKCIISARRSIANIINVPGRIGHSLDDECLDIAIVRRKKYSSLLNLDRLSEILSSRANAKSLTTLIIEDTNGTNDHNSDANDLSVAEKSMRMLNVTAEDVMDARARIQERAYWEKQEAKTKSKMIEEIIEQIPIENDKEEKNNISKNKQIIKENLDKALDYILKKEDINEHSLMKKQLKNDNEVIRDNKKEDILIKNQENTPLVKDNIFDEVDSYAQSMRFSDTYTKEKKEDEKEEGIAKIVQCPSFTNQDTKKLKTKPCASLVRKLEAKLSPILINKKEIWYNKKKHFYQVNTELMPSGSGASNKECNKSLKTSCACHRALHSKNERYKQLIDKNNKFDINKKEFQPFTTIVNMQRSKLNKFAFKYSEVYHLKKQIKKWEESHGNQYWGSKSLAETARPSGYAKNDSNVFDNLSKIVNCQKSIQTEIPDGSTMMSDSLNERYRLRYKQMRNKRSVDLHSIYSVASYREKNRAEEKVKASEIYNNFMLKNKAETKTKEEYDLPSTNGKLSIEETVQVNALRDYNEFGLSENRREFEARKEQELAKKSEEIKISVTNDLILSKNKKEVKKTKGYKLSSSSQRSAIDEQSASRVCNELTQLGSERELRIERKRDLSRNETECEGDIEISTSISNPSIDSYNENMISIRQKENFSLNARYARQAHMTLNLREITRNIECTVYPRGITLTNKNLHSQFLETGRFRESQQRDIVDDNTASMLHSAFFFKPEIVTRIFRAQTEINESSSSFPTFWQEDSSVEFVCHINNEMIVYNQNPSYDFERMVENDRNGTEDAVFSNADNHERDLCIIFIGQEQIPSESETVIIENSMTAGSQSNARSSEESTRMRNIFIFEENCNYVDSATNDNLPVQLITDVLRNFNIDIPEGNVRNVASLNQEYNEHISNVNAYNNPQSRKSNVDDINRENGERDKISSHNNADIDDTIDKIKQTLNSTDSDYVENITSYASSFEKLNDSRDKKCLDRINNHRENEIYEDNLFFRNATLQLSDDDRNNAQCDVLNNKTGHTNTQNMFNHIPKISLKLSIPGPSSLIESDNHHLLKSYDEKVPQLSDRIITLNNQNEKSKPNLKIKNCDTRIQKSDISKSENTIRDSSKNENKNVSQDVSDFSAKKLFKMHSDEKLHQDDSFYFTYKTNDDPGTPVSLENGSLMEEFLDDRMSFNSSYV